MTTKITKTEMVVKELNSMEPEFSQALPAHIPSKQFIRSCLMAVQADPKLIDADRRSLYMACQKAAADGLVLDGREAALVIFKGTVAYMPMVSGILKKIRNTGELVSISAHVVYKNDMFRHIKSPVESVEHESVALDEDPGEKIGVYAVAVLKSGEHQYSVMRKDQVMAVRKSAKTGMIWEGDFSDQMWEKSAIRRLCKRLPSSSEMDRVFEHDNEGYDFKPEFVPPEPISPQANGQTTTASKILSQEEPEREPGDESVPEPIEGDVF